MYPSFEVDLHFWSGIFLHSLDCRLILSSFSNNIQPQNPSLYKNKSRFIKKKRIYPLKSSEVQQGAVEPTILARNDHYGRTNIELLAQHLMLPKYNSHFLESERNRKRKLRYSHNRYLNHLL